VNRQKFAVELLLVFECIKSFEQCGIWVEGPLCYRHGEKAPAIVRPLREMAARDLATFSSMHGLDAWPAQPPPFWRQDSRAAASLNAVVDKFVTDMQLRLPSTVSTVMRVMDRLEVLVR
jgi:hypothetical protein